MARLRFGWICCLCFGLLALGSANEIESFLDHEALPVPKNELDQNLHISINKLIDRNIGQIQGFLKVFDPSELPDIPLSNKGQLTNGWLFEVSTLKRTGHSSIKYANKILRLDINVGWDLLKFDYDYAYKIWLIPRHGRLHGSVDNVSVNLQIYVDFRKNAVVLDNFELTEIGKIGIELEGTFGDNIRALIGELIANLIKELVKHTVEGIASKTIQERIDEFNSHKPKETRRFTFINLVELHRNGSKNEDDIQDNH